MALEVFASRRRWPPIIWDVTYERGVMWRGLDVQPTWRSDILPKEEGVIEGDYRQLHRIAPVFGIDLVDVIVFDPPHAMDGGGSGGMGQGGWADRYGTRSEVTQRDEYRAKATHHNSIAWTFDAFLRSAHQVLEPDGIILAKIGDQVHGAENQWEHCVLWQLACQAGMRPCDMMIKERQQPKRTDPKWLHQYHLDKNHTFWMVVRNGARC